VGDCSEDCAFCTQSVHHGSVQNSFKKKPLQDVLKEAEIAFKNGALGFCLVTQGKSLDDDKLEFICQVSKEVSKRFDFNLIACAGIASKEALNELKKSGIKTYNHNLETSREYYSQICSTMEWDDRYNTCLNVKEVGLNLCSGGIFGIGEGLEDRDSLFRSLAELSPKSAPINFFHPNKSLPLDCEVLPKDEALSIIKLAKRYLKNSIIMSAGGRELVFGDDIKELLEAGVNAVIIGNYLTTQGFESSKDLELIKKAGYKKVVRDGNS